MRIKLLNSGSLLASPGGVLPSPRPVILIGLEWLGLGNGIFLRLTRRLHCVAPGKTGRLGVVPGLIGGVKELQLEDLEEAADLAR